MNILVLIMHIIVLNNFKTLVASNQRSNLIGEIIKFQIDYVANLNVISA